MLAAFQHRVEITPQNVEYTPKFCFPVVVVVVVVVVVTVGRIYLLTNQAVELLGPTSYFLTVHCFIFSYY